MSGLLRSNVVVAGGTALSRVTGLLRLIVLGYVLGQTALSDAYLIANETPNIVYELLLGGVLSATLVPLFSTFVENEDDESTNVILTVSAMLMAALTVVAVIAAPLIFGLYSVNVAEDVDADLYRSVGTTLARIFLIQIFFYGLVGLANAFLNSRRRFFAAAWSPILPNVIIIAFLLSLPNAGSAEWQLTDVLSDDRLRYTLGLGATVGIASMAFVLLPAMARTGFRFRPNFDYRHPAVRKLLSLSFWTLGFVIANQIALLVVRNLAEPGSSDASAYINAFTFFVLPHGLLAVSIATTFQPEMSRSVARRDRTGFTDQASLGLRMTALFTVPAGVGIFVLRQPIIGALLQRGNFSAEDADAAQRALAGLALGLGAFSIYLFVLRGFYAHKDTKTPFKINVVENAINIGLAVVLVGRYGVLGLGLAYALAYVISSLWAMQVLSYKVPGFDVRSILASIWRMLLASALMGEAVWLVTQQVGGNTGVDAIVRLVVGATVGVVVYAGILTALGAPELDAARRRFARS
ncbi:MAG: murein biosynthesis integral membrane protein MurJ [Ilumatobacteraceae bacterium]